MKIGQFGQILAGLTLLGSFTEHAQASELFLQYQVESYVYETSFGSYSALLPVGLAVEYVHPVTNWFHVRGVGAVSLETGEQTIPIFIDAGGGAALSVIGGAPLKTVSNEITLEATPHSHGFFYADFVNRIFDVRNVVPPPEQKSFGRRRDIARTGNYITPRAGLGYDIYLNPRGTATFGVRAFGTRSLNLEDGSITSYGATFSLGYQFSDDIFTRLLFGG